MSEQSERKRIILSGIQPTGTFTLGNYIGAGLVVKNGSRIVRPIIAVVLSILFAKTAWDYFF